MHLELPEKTDSNPDTCGRVHSTPTVVQMPFASSKDLKTYLLHLIIIPKPWHYFKISKIVSCIRSFQYDSRLCFVAVVA